MAHNPSKAELRAERDYLLARADGANRVRFDEDRRWTGTSSNALVRYVFGGAIPTSAEFPMDVADLAACYRAVYRLPDHLKRPEGRANDMICQYRAAVLGRYELHQMDAMLAKETHAIEVRTTK